MVASVHQLNEAFAAIRGVGRDNIEAYGRVLRTGGVLPATKRGSGATVPTTVHAGYLVAAVLRGSPLKATENAREIGDLIVHSDGGALLEPVLDRQLAMFGWPADMSFAGMVGWLIDRHLDGTIGEFIDGDYKIEVDRYWTRARLYCQPAAPLVDQYVETWRAVNELLLPDRNPNGALRRPMEIGFHTPLLHEAKISYGVDKERNREAHRQYRELRKRSENHDLWGSEAVTQRTILAIAEVFK